MAEQATSTVIGEEKQPLIDRTINKVLDDIRKNKAIPKNNAKELEDWAEFLKAKNSSKNTIAKHMFSLKAFLLVLGNIEVRKATREDIQKVMVKINEMRSPDTRKPYAEWTKSSIKIVIKAWYKHILGEDEYYPVQVRWMKDLMPKQKSKLTPNDMLTEEEVLAMIRNATNARDKAIVAILFDSGVRAGELLNLRKRDIKISDRQSYITVNGKTGIRTVPLTFSVEYLSEYINTIPKRGTDEYLWMDVGSWTNRKKPLQRIALSVMLARVANEAGVTKRVNPHAFRHARATFYANRLKEQQLKKFFGWTGGSKMAATYVHLQDKDVNDAVLEAYGKKPRDEVKPLLSNRNCPRCKKENAPDAILCNRCGANIDMAVAIDSVVLDKGIAEHFDNPDFMRSPEFRKIVEQVIRGELQKLNTQKKGK